MKKLLFLLVLATTCIYCAQKLKPRTSFGAEAPASQKKPHVILISLDGFRWDYVERFRPPNLSKFISEGVKAESLIPCFPSKTFPNHYTIATGMYPDHHGLVDNSFWSPEKKGVYKIRDREKVQDGSWYGGTPLWVLAEQSDMTSASFFFVGSEADVKGVRPTYYFDYDGSIPNEERVDQALEWLAMPSEKRPQLITMYFSDMDDIGHRAGPNDDKRLKEKLMPLDSTLGKLFNGVKNTGLPVNIILVSDHGMHEIKTENFIPGEIIENDELYRTVHNGAIAHLYLNENVSEKDALEYLEGKEKNWKVYRTNEAPGFDITPTSENWGDLQIIPDRGWYFKQQRTIGFLKTKGVEVGGEHGLDPNIRELHGIFYANGPAFKNGLIVPSVKNIHIYPLVCEILGLKIPKEVDGSLKFLQNTLN